MCSSDLEIGFSLAPARWGLGYASEAVAAVVDHVLERLGLARVVAFTLADNEAAQRVLEHAGLRYIGLDGDECIYYRAGAGVPGTDSAR